MIIRKEVEIGGKNLIIETGRFAKQADGGILVQYGGTVVLVTAVASIEKTVNYDFTPLTVDYREKAYAVGRIPGGFFKREGKPTEKEILSSRLIDRPIRPLLCKNFPYETQVVASILSSDGETEGDILGIIGASAALCISDIPFSGPMSAVRIGRIDGSLIVNPTYNQLKKSDMEIVVVGNEDNIIMVEGEAKEITEEEMINALKFGFEELKKAIPIQKELENLCGKGKRPLENHIIDEKISEKIKETLDDKIKEILNIKDKTTRRRTKKQLLARLEEEFCVNIENNKAITSDDIKNIITETERAEMRRLIVEDGIRIDGRSINDIREISCEIGVLPRTHGSALFTRGQTQSLLFLL